ncbi:hypothetical protein XELAEV_18033213mg [Xenopus laevis]|uniref:Antimicrobial peptide n=1 Tax=Xenopus laevis TaxID=8355 RepID=A0A974HDT4_XENLA|nr:hypothetical protein XELAEV_18033213mg [Xenopus laevis]
MFKGIFLCVFFAVLIANSMAQPEGFADEDDVNKRDVRGFGSFLGTLFKTAAKIIPGLLSSRQEREAFADELKRAI